MREWLRTRWRYVAAAIVFIFGALAYFAAGVRDSLVAKRDARMDRKLDDDHDDHVTHEAKADELERQADELERRIPPDLTDYSGATSQEIADLFRELAKERESK